MSDICAMVVWRYKEKLISFARNHKKTTLRVKQATTTYLFGSFRVKNLPNVQLSISTETERSTHTNVQLIAHRLIKLLAGTRKDIHVTKIRVAPLGNVVS